MRRQCFQFAHLLLAVVALHAVASPADAGQPWSCICNGERNRSIASTNHCEHAMGLPKGQSCSFAQWRKVYGPHCAAKGCVLAGSYKRLSDHYVENSGNVMIRNIDDLACMDRCTTDAKCRMYEHYTGPEDGGVKCNLYYTIKATTRGGSSSVGIKE